MGEARTASEMVRYANRSRTGANVPNGSTPCVTHHFPAGSLHAPYDLLSLLAVGNVTIKAPRWKAEGVVALRVATNSAPLRYPIWPSRAYCIDRGMFFGNLVLRRAAKARRAAGTASSTVPARRAARTRNSHSPDRTIIISSPIFNIPA